MPTPDPYWLTQFRERMKEFAPSPEPGQTPISVKVRVETGCFHREHSPHAYQILDDYVQKNPLKGEVRIEEHESGPEILAYAAAGVAITTAVINLTAAIIKARSEGQKKGDHPNAPLQLIVRRIDVKGDYHEEKILSIPSGSNVDVQAIAMAMLKPDQAKPKLSKPRKTPKKPKHPTTE